MPDQKLDDMLKAFLERSEKDRQEGHTLSEIRRELRNAIGNVADGLSSHAADDKAMWKEIRDTLSSHSSRLSSAEVNIENLKERADDSQNYSRHAVELAVAAREKGKRDSFPPRWLKRLVAPAAVKIGLAVAGGLVGGLGWALHLIEASSQAHHSQTQAQETKDVSSR